MSKDNRIIRKIRKSQTLIIKTIKSDRWIKRRLAELGITEGAQIRICGYTGHTFRVKTRDSFYALSEQILSNLEFEVEPSANG